MSIKEDKRVVVTLDAGGTNFVFSAIQGSEEVIEPIQLPAQPDNLSECLETAVNGFQQAIDRCDTSPVAISFAFPGPADYPKGIIGDLGNLPAFRGGVALGPMLEEKFHMPVFINNDGDLFVFGEAIAGLLPHVNSLLEQGGSPKRYNNLFGITLGTGFGGGIVRNGELFIGDNSAGGEIWSTSNKLDPESIAEEGVSIRAIRRVYTEKSGISFDESPEPKDIYRIVKGEIEGNKEAAVEAFKCMGIVTGNCLANTIALIDGIIVIGGGLSGAHEVFLPTVVTELNGTLLCGSDPVTRLETKAFNLEDPAQLEIFIKGDAREITIPGTEKKICYDPLQRIGVGVSMLGTNKAVSIGAYAFALHELDKQ